MAHYPKIVLSDRLFRAAGPSGSIQFNSGGYFSGSSNLIYDYTASILYYTGSLNISGNINQYGNQEIWGDVIVHGDITAEQYILSSSVLYYTTSYFSGSTKFGDTLDDIHQFTGSVYITGSSYLIGNSTITGSMFMRSGSIVMSGPTASITGVDYIDFDNQYTIGTNEPAWREGRLFYDSGSGGLAFYNWERDVTLNIGQEQWLRARNQTGATITDGTVVRLLGAIGDRPTIEKAQSLDQTNIFSLNNDIIGMATHNIENGTDGFITTFGLVNGVNTANFSAGDLLWVSQSAGQYTNIPPAPPFDKLFVGIVTRANANNGTIFITPQPTLHFHDIASVSASVYQMGDLWMYRSGSTGQVNAWINTKQLTGSYAISGSLTLNGPLVATSFSGAFSGSFSGSLFGTASWAVTASRSISSSYAISSSYSVSSSNAVSASYSFSSSYAVSSSFAVSSSRAVSSSFATTASYVNLLAGPNITINYQTNGIAISGSGGGSAISFYSGSTLLTSNLSSLRITGSGVNATVNASNGVTMSFSSSAGGGSAITVTDDSGTLTTNLTQLNFLGDLITSNAGGNVTVEYYTPYIICTNQSYIDDAANMVTDRFYYGSNNSQGWNGYPWDLIGAGAWTAVNALELTGKSDYSCGVVLPYTPVANSVLQVCGLATNANGSFATGTKGFRVGLGYLTCDGIDSGNLIPTMIASGNFVPNTDTSLVCGYSIEGPADNLAACTTYLYVGFGVGDAGALSGPLSFTYTIKMYVK